MLQVRGLRLSHAESVTRAQLEEATPVVADSVAYAPAPDGRSHLDEITMVFRLPKQPEHLTIVIRGAPDVPTRVLMW